MANPQPVKDRVRELHLKILGRPASESEAARAVDFLEHFAKEWSGSSPVTQAPGEELAENTAGNQGSTSDNGVANPDDIPRNDLTAVTTVVEAKDPESAAWMNYIQALYASAEFRFIR